MVTYNRPNGIYSLYVNGVKVLNNVQNASYVKPAADLQNPWVFGHGETLTDANDSWKGYLDDVYIYNRVIYPSEALALYQLAPPAPPTFTIGLQNQSLFVGQTLNLSPAVDGTPPITFQWQLNGANIPGAVSEQLVIGDAQLTNAGTYTLIASNSVHTASSTAVVTVEPVTSVTNGLSGYWKFDETTGDTAFDSSGTGDNGTVFNTSQDGGQWTNGLVGGALEFRGLSTGAGDYVTITNWPAASHGNMTFAAWVLAPTLPNNTNEAIACGGSGADGTGQFVLSVVAANLNNYLRGSVEDASGKVFTITAGIPFPSNVWQHAALVAGTNSVVLYQNGVVVASNLFDGSLFNPTNVFSLGALMAPGDTGAQADWWQGLMDEAAYWTRGLSPAQVFELYAAGKAGRAVTSADSFSNSPPLIGSQPQGGVVYLDNPFTFQVGATGPSALSYQWTRNETAISGATNASYTLPAAGFGDAASYAVVVSGPSGSVTSAPAALTITAPLPAPDAGLLLYLKLDDAQGSTNALDSTTNADDGTLVNFFSPVTNWVPGILNGALLFSAGAQNYEAVAVPDQPYLEFSTNSFSLSFWAKGTPAQLNSGGVICKGLGGGGECYCVDFYAAGLGNGVAATENYRFFNRNSAGLTTAPQISSGVACNGNWQHIAVVADFAAGQASMYIDGLFVGAVALPPDGLLVNSSTLDLGARQFQGGYTLPFNGVLDDIRVYGRAITPIEVRALYYQGNPPALSISSSADKTATVSWPFETITTYQLESSTNLMPGSWKPVAGVTTNYVVVSPASSPVFYRLLRAGNGE